jgi:signal peptidase I
MKGIIREILITLGLAVVIFLFLQTTIQSSIVLGSSMEPNLVNGQRLIINKAVYHFASPQRGDVIILRPPPEPQKEYVKRVIGLPGDTIEIRNGVVKVNGYALKENYIKILPDYSFGPYKVQDNNYFVLGDNRANSSDSHTGWTVTRQNIVGKAWLSIWPLKDWGLVRSYPLGQQLAGQLQMPGGSTFINIISYP